MIWIVKIFVFAAVCVFVENICSGIWRAFISKEFTPEEKKQGIMWSYLYMLPVYFIFPVPFELFGYLISGLSWYWIMLINYVFGVVAITAIETGLGAFLEKTLGYCPWGKYTKEQYGFIGGYSRWPISLAFGGMAVIFYYFVMLFNYSVRWM
jgi:MFS family permease